MKDIRFEGNVLNFIFKGKGGGREGVSKDRISLVVVIVNYVYIWDL